MQVRHLTNCTRAGDVLGRIGGEEFAVVLMNADFAMADLVSSQMCQSIKIDAAGEIEIETKGIELTISVGGVMALQGQDLTDLMRCADQALYRAKSTGRARVVFYEREHRGLAGSRAAPYA